MTPRGRGVRDDQGLDMTSINSFRPLAAVQYKPPVGPQDPVNHDKHYDPGHGTRPPKPDTGVDPAPRKNHGPNCGNLPKLDYI